jgi:hypothetical protein
MPQMDKEMYLDDIFWILLASFFFSGTGEAFHSEDVRFFLYHQFYKKNTKLLKENTYVTQTIFENFYKKS